MQNYQAGQLIAVPAQSLTKANSLNNDSSHTAVWNDGTNCRLTYVTLANEEIVVWNWLDGAVTGPPLTNTTR